MSADPSTPTWLVRSRRFASDVLGNGIMRKSQTDSPARAQEVARGYLLICVFYIHAMFGVAVHMGENAWAVLYQLKLLAPNVAAYFVLSGMAAPALAKKGFEPVLRHSVTLLLFAIASHIVGFAILLVGQGYPSVWSAAKAFARPIVFGVGYSSFVAWFFVVLAVARLLAYAFLRSWLRFAAIVAVLAGLVWLSKKLGLPDNIYEWRNWPAATLFFLVGMRMPQGKAIPNWAAVAALALTVLLMLINRQGLFRAGPCWACDLHFVPQPMIGQFGSVFVYVPQQLLFAVFLIWAAQRSAGMFIGKVGLFFGQSSLPILLLHGWVLLTLYPGMLAGMPTYETPYLFVGIFSSAIVVHALLYVWFRRPLDWLQMQIFAISRLGQGRKRPARSARGNIAD